MKMLVFSDSHGKRDRIQNVLSKSPDIKMVLFLGDGRDDIDGIINSPIGARKNFITVLGNTDYGFADIPTERSFELCGKRILMLHGHKVFVKQGLGHAISRARELEADILLYGHTHIPHSEYIPGENGEKPLYILNPGSIGSPRHGEPSFGYIEIKDGGIIVNHTEYKEK